MLEFWSFKTRRYEINYYTNIPTLPCSVATVTHLPLRQIVGFAIDEAGLKTKQQLVVEACLDATDRIIFDRILEYSKGPSP